MIVQQFTGKQRVKTWSRFYFLICTALPDELLVAVFRHFGLKEIVGTLSKVSKRWWNISQTDGLWHSLPLDKWNVYHLTEAQFLNIVSHSRAFSHFSMSYVDVRVSQSMLNEILQNRLRVAHKLTHLDLSGQPIRTLNCLPNQKSEAVGLEVLILNDRLYVDENSFSESIIKQMSKINISFMNWTKLCSNEAVKLAVSLPSWFSLCVKGITLSPIDVRFIVDGCKNLKVMEMSNSADERDDECRLLASECDVSLFIY